MNNKNIYIQIEFTVELQYLKRQKIELQRTLIINRRLSSVNVDGNIVIITVIFLGVIPATCLL